jgi:two-component sensor histidine kinase
MPDENGRLPPILEDDVAPVIASHAIAAPIERSGGRGRTRRQPDRGPMATLRRAKPSIPDGKARPAMMREQESAGAIVGGIALPDVQLLMREMTHRISNEFASAIGLVAISASRCAGPEAKQALNGVRERLEQYALVHHALRMPECGIVIDSSDHLRRLCLAMSRAKLDRQNIELEFVERPLFIASERCWMLALIVHELVTNSVRHAFGPAGGSIRVELAARKGGARCIVSDNGQGSTHRAPHGGLVIIHSLAATLGGTVVQKFGPRGSVSIVAFPMDGRASSGRIANGVAGGGSSRRNSAL